MARTAELPPNLRELIRSDPATARRLVTAERCRRSLAELTKAAWPIINPAEDLIWNWHLDAICRHLEAAFRGELAGADLIINVPPGSSKSTITCVMWPVWCWLQDPAWRAIFSSHAYRLAIRDSNRFRAIVKSAWFRETFEPDWTLATDHQEHVENTATGWRMATTVAGESTGHRAGAVIVDDPHKVMEAISLSDVSRQEVKDWWDNAFANRLNDLRRPVRVVIMQRLHTDDLTGHLLERARLGNGKVVHLRLPSEFNPARKCTTALGFEDPRTEAGELLDPVRFPAAVLADERSRLGPIGYAGQHDQEPVPAGGALFTAEFPVVRSMPARVLGRVRFWDKAGTSGAGSFTAGCRMSRGTDGRFYIENIRRGQWAMPERERTIRAVADADPTGTEIWIEQEPGSGGKDSAAITIMGLAGHRVQAERPTGDKAFRAGPLADQAAMGNVVLVDDGNWDVEAFRRECRVFPLGKYKDQVDAASGAFNKLALKRRVGQALVGPEMPILHGYPEGY